ncbi:MAG: uroporphyrinogen decarboxylase [Pseudomonadota bacterium]
MSVDLANPILSVLARRKTARPPVWFMRQAGRHLPEYLEVRAKAKDFLDFCYSPSLATEATLQPIRRYGMDAAILFADILLILDALGLEVRFEAGVGPLVEKVEAPQRLDKVPPHIVADKLSPVYETVERVRSQLGPETALIGFAGAPWTVALYAIEGRGGTEKTEARLWAYQAPDDLDAVLSILVEATAHYLKAQADAGAQVLMLFESWAEGLPEAVFQRIVVEPNKALVSRLRALGVKAPIIGFPRGAGAMVGAYVAETGVDLVGLDTAAVPAHVNAALPEGYPVQGHLDPLLLVAGGDALDQGVRALIESYRDRPHIFNLGHGVRPETPIAHVERAVTLVKGEV